MAYSLADRLVVGVASSALFDLTESDAVFRTDGELAYRTYQEDKRDVRLAAGVAMPFIKRLLSLNDLGPAAGSGPLVEVIAASHTTTPAGLLSRLALSLLQFSSWPDWRLSQARSPLAPRWCLRRSGHTSVGQQCHLVTQSSGGRSRSSRPTPSLRAQC